MAKVVTIVIQTIVEGDLPKPTEKEIAMLVNMAGSMFGGTKATLSAMGVQDTSELKIGS